MTKVVSPSLERWDIPMSTNTKAASAPQIRPFAENDQVRPPSAWMRPPSRRALWAAIAQAGQYVGGVTSSTIHNIPSYLDGGGFFSRQKRETSVATILGLSAPPKPKYGRLVRACFRRPTSLRSACVGLPQLAFMRLLNFRVRTICAQKQRANQGGLIGSHASGLHP